ANTLLEKDWYVDPNEGIQVYQFERSSEDGPYQILHLVMDVVRQKPPRGKRPPGPAPTNDAASAYRQVARKLFERAETRVDENTFPAVTRNAILDSLARIKSRARQNVGDDL